MAEALKHAEAAAKADDTKSITEHAEAAKTHAKTADEHLDAGITSLNDAIDHGKMKHADSAKKVRRRSRNSSESRAINELRFSIQGMAG